MRRLHKVVLVLSALSLVVILLQNSMTSDKLGRVIKNEVSTGTKDVPKAEEAAKVSELRPEESKQIGEATKESEQPAEQTAQTDVLIGNVANKVIDSSKGKTVNLGAFEIVEDPVVNESLPLCPEQPPKLVGRVRVLFDNYSMKELEAMNPDMLLGGRYTPSWCLPRHKVAIVVPYRNRTHQLSMFLLNLLPILQRQLIKFGIFVIDQEMPTTFNRGMLMNIGFIEANKLGDFDCVIFHDVDLYPEDDRHLYNCPVTPKHMSAAVDKFNYKLPYAALFGGITSFKNEQFVAINGYSNTYFGWGAEDDDLYHRVADKMHYKISRSDMDKGRYTMFKHEHEKENKANPDRMKLLGTWRTRVPYDGLNTLNYTMTSRDFLPLCTMVHISVVAIDPMVSYNKFRKISPSQKPPPAFTMKDLQAIRIKSSHVETPTKDVVPVPTPEIHTLNSTVIMVTFTEITGFRTYLSNLSNTFYVVSEREWGSDIDVMIAEIDRLKKCELDPEIINSTKARFPSQSGCEESMISVVGDTCWSVFHYYCADHGFASCADNVVCAHQMMLETKKPTGFGKVDTMTDTSWVECQEKVHHLADSVAHTLRDECFAKNNLLIEVPNTLVSLVAEMMEKDKNMSFIYLPVDKPLLSEMAQVSPVRAGRACSRLKQDYPLMGSYIDKHKANSLYIPARTVAENLHANIKIIHNFIMGKGNTRSDKPSLINPNCSPA